MKSAILITLVAGLISLSGFNPEHLNYEQVAFDYFISDILKSDFKDISKVEFKGQTENTYSTLGDFRFCLKPAEKLQSLIKDVTKGSTRNVKDIRYEQVKSIIIGGFNDDSDVPKLYIYPAVRVADNFYVFMSLHSQENVIANYVFELNVVGEIKRSCKMD